MPIKDDFMEFNSTWKTGTAYSCTLHKWYGKKGEKILDYVNNSNTTLHQPLGTDFTQWHTYGTLWVPATTKNNWMGYRQAFFDGKPMAAVCWRGNQVGTYPTSGSYHFSLKDQDQMEVILGACQGGIPTMKVDYVRIYAVSPSSVTVVPSGPR